MRISLKLYKDTLGHKQESLNVVEIGVYKGDNAEVMLEKCPNIKKLYLIDDYNPESRWFTDEKGQQMTKDDADRFFDKVKKRFENNEKVHLLRKSSLEAVKDFPDEFFDYVYIDGGHCYDNVKQDLEIWFPKVKMMGMFAGHDSHYPDVTKAIVEFAVMKKITIFHVGIVRNSAVPFEVDLNEFMDWWVWKVPLNTVRKAIIEDLQGLHLVSTEAAKKVYPNNIYL